MKHIKHFESTSINEGKIFQFFLYYIVLSVGKISDIKKKLNGTFVDIKFKNKSIEKEINRNLVKLTDYIIFDAIKYYRNKKYKKKAYELSFSGLIKSRSGVDLYDLCNDILSKINKDNIIFSDNESILKNQELKVGKLVDLVKSFKSTLKLIDDDIAEDKKIANQFEELAELFKDLDPRSGITRPKADVLKSFDRVSSKLDDMSAPKDLDDILDKISEYGIDSLTPKEKDDLKKWTDAI